MALMPDESSSEIVRRVFAALDEVQAQVKRRGSLSISEVAAISQKHDVDPANILRTLESDHDCFVDWPRQQVSCR